MLPDSNVFRGGIKSYKKISILNRFKEIGEVTNWYLAVRQ